MSRRPPGAARPRRFSLTWPVVLGAVVVVLTLGWLALQPGGDSGSPVARRQAPSGGEVGELAPPLTVRTISGTDFSVPAGGRPTVLFFMAGWCDTCLPEAMALDHIQRDFGDRIAILAIDADPSDSLPTLQGFVRAAGNPAYPFAQDTHGELVTAFSARTLDTTVITDASGRIVFRDAVPSDEATLRAALREVGLS